MLAQAKAGSRQAGAALEQGRAAVAAATAAKDSLPLVGDSSALLFGAGIPAHQKPEPGRFNRTQRA